MSHTAWDAIDRSVSALAQTPTGMPGRFEVGTKVLIRFKADEPGVVGEVIDIDRDKVLVRRDGGHIEWFDEASGLGAPTEGGTPRIDTPVGWEALETALDAAKTLGAVLRAHPQVLAHDALSSQVARTVGEALRVTAGGPVRLG